MDLILWRHAEAYDLDDPSGDDMLRELTPRGIKQAARMANWLDRQLPEGTKVLCSPATRAEQTAKALDRKYKVRHDLQPNARVDQLLGAAQWPQSDSTVMLIGHQPALGGVVARLMGMPEGNCSLKKGAVWWLRTRQRDGQSSTVLVTIQTPEYI
jgi:phosphohistidine phosphatase